jgi:hypothetical protein
MKRRDLLRSAIALPLATTLPTLAQSAPATNRAFWLTHLHRVADPVLEALAAGRLRATMPIEAHPAAAASRPKTTHLEAFGRLLSGIAPWLDLPEAANSAALTRQALANALDPKSPDHLQFDIDNQNLVDAAFLALAVLRAPRALNSALKPDLKAQLIAALQSTRVLEPGFNNWLLFAACIEAALSALGAQWDEMRVDYALREHMAWYVGDGTYGDGPHFHSDYYNSYVIHPFLLAVLDQVGQHKADWKSFAPIARERATRYAAVQERMIAPDGSYPVLGRSITYRCGAFHQLADTALRGTLPSTVSPAQARCALAAVIARTLIPAGTFDAKGWLQIGLAGHQPALGETYISTGSLYLCANAFLPLGLPADDPFWSTPGTSWTSQKVWSGANLPNDHAIDG